MLTKSRCTFFHSIAVLADSRCIQMSGSGTVTNRYCVFISKRIVANSRAIIAQHVIVIAAAHGYAAGIASRIARCNTSRIKLACRYGIC